MQMFTTLLSVLVVAILFGIASMGINTHQVQPHRIIHMGSAR